MSHPKHQPFSMRTLIPFLYKPTHEFESMAVTYLALSQQLDIKHGAYTDNWHNRIRRSDGHSLFQNRRVPRNSYSRSLVANTNKK
jgi:hypothetical protein